MISVREKPPLRLMGLVTAPGGQVYRLGEGIRDARNAMQGLTYSTVAPGGFESCSFELLRDVRRKYADLGPLGTIQIRGAGGREIAGEFRLEQVPAQGGFDSRISPQAVGWQTHLDDDESAAEVFVDGDLSQWTGPTLNDQIYNEAQSYMENDFSIVPDRASQQSMIQLLLAGSTGTYASPIADIDCKAWYDAFSARIAMMWYTWQFSATTGTGYIARLAAGDSDVEAAAGEETSSNFAFGGGSGYWTPTNKHRFVQVRWRNNAMPLSQSQNRLARIQIVLYGSHNLPLYGPDPGGVLASDVATYVIAKWCPLLDFTTGLAGSVQPSSFVIPQLSFLQPGKPSDMLNAAFSFELLDWFVWENQTFFLSGRPHFSADGGLSDGGTYKTRLWQARSGPSQLNNTGPSVSRVYNGVVVTYTGIDGLSYAVGPTGSGLPLTDDSLLDSDPLNPANQIGINRFATVAMQGTSTKVAAIVVGARFLQEQKLLDRSGEASLIGWVQDSLGVWEPAWKVRGGDYIKFIDAADRSYRRIVHTEYDESTKTNALQLDQPPDALAALLQRLNIVLVRFGIT